MKGLILALFVFCVIVLVTTAIQSSDAIQDFTFSSDELLDQVNDNNAAAVAVRRYEISDVIDYWQPIIAVVILLIVLVGSVAGWSRSDL